METASRQLCDQILAFVSRCKTIFLHCAENEGLTYVQLYVLYMVYHEPLTMGHLATTLHCDASNITGVVERLVRRKLLTRQPSQQDRRVKVLAITEAGQQLVDDLRSKLPSLLGCTSLSAAESKQLQDLLLKLTSSQDVDGSQPSSIHG